MAHDNQVPKEESRESLNALSKRLKTSREVVADWLRLYQAMPYMRQANEITAEVILFYLDSLGGLQNPLALHKAFQRCRDHIKFLPQPAEILEAYGVEVEKLMQRESQKREAVELCGECRGTGWKKVARPDGEGEWAVACECRKAEKKASA